MSGWTACLRRLLRGGGRGVRSPMPRSTRPDDEIAAAGAAIIEVPIPRPPSPIWRAWRDRLEGRVIGITGSTGKTTTKNLVRDVLARSWQRGGNEGQPEQRARRPQHRAGRSGRHAKRHRRDGHARPSSARGAVRVRAPAMGPCHQRRRKPHRASGQPREHRARQSRASSRRCPQAAWRSSTPRTI